ncbi:hypothetical protein LTR56_015520 [Elasticomyces elasticus]|nr:hypothetical protein LTR56_015520 [Elasticomyces elasticus]KAK3662553.1 hypothetical protein LTR22_006619 [Elasticomyces elasticus]KAK4927896.1 hypothetical protein LTR49_005318 [Elasticomyces elasticus]KAK5756038.1 hypothetical protein LTS12_013828 [Elasticomyces elasticus]
MRPEPSAARPAGRSAAQDLVESIEAKIHGGPKTLIPKTVWPLERDDDRRMLTEEAPRHARVKLTPREFSLDLLDALETLADDPSSTVGAGRRYIQCAVDIRKGTGGSKHYSTIECLPADVRNAIRIRDHVRNRSHDIPISSLVGSVSVPIELSAGGTVFRSLSDCEASKKGGAVQNQQGSAGNAIQPGEYIKHGGLEGDGGGRISSGRNDEGDGSSAAVMNPKRLQMDELHAELPKVPQNSTLSTPSTVARKTRKQRQDQDSSSDSESEPESPAARGMHHGASTYQIAHSKENAGAGALTSSNARTDEDSDVDELNDLFGSTTTAAAKKGERPLYFSDILPETLFPLKRHATEERYTIHTLAAASPQPSAILESQFEPDLQKKLDTMLECSYTEERLLTARSSVIDAITWRKQTMSARDQDVIECMPSDVKVALELFNQRNDGMPLGSIRIGIALQGGDWAEVDGYGVVRAYYDANMAEIDAPGNRASHRENTRSSEPIEREDLLMTNFRQDTPSDDGTHQPAHAPKAELDSEDEDHNTAVADALKQDVDANDHDEDNGEGDGETSGSAPSIEKAPAGFNLMLESLLPRVRDENDLANTDAKNLDSLPLLSPSKYNPTLIRYVKKISDEATEESAWLGAWCIQVAVAVRKQTTGALEQGAVECLPTDALAAFMLLKKLLKHGSPQKNHLLIRLADGSSHATVPIPPRFYESNADAYTTTTGPMSTEPISARTTGNGVVDDAKDNGEPLIRQKHDEEPVVQVEPPVRVDITDQNDATAMEGIDEHGKEPGTLYVERDGAGQSSLTALASVASAQGSGMDAQAAFSGGVGASSTVWQSTPATVGNVGHDRSKSQEPGDDRVEDAMEVYGEFVGEAAAGVLDEASAGVNTSNSASAVAHAGHDANSGEGDQQDHAATGPLKEDGVMIYEDELVENPLGAIAGNGGAIGGVVVKHGEQVEDAADTKCACVPYAEFTEWRRRVKVKPLKFRKAHRTRIQPIPGDELLPQPKNQRPSHNYPVYGSMKVMSETFVSKLGQRLCMVEIEQHQLLVQEDERLAGPADVYVCKTLGEFVLNPQFTSFFDGKTGALYAIQPNRMLGSVSPARQVGQRETYKVEQVIGVKRKECDSAQETSSRTKALRWSRYGWREFVFENPQEEFKDVTIRSKLSATSKKKLADVVSMIVSTLSKGPDGVRVV